jgi:hypothetical protein
LGITIVFGVAVENEGMKVHLTPIEQKSPLENRLNNFIMITT